MARLLLKFGLMLMLAAGVIIAIAFVAFAFFALLLFAPGLLLYNAGLKSIYQSGSVYKNEVKTIDVTPKSSTGEFANNGKNILKSGVRKIRNFLNKYAD